jgi:hypothetical protein
MSRPKLPAKYRTTLPEGEIYHGTSADRHFRYPHGPAWFSDSEDTAHTFSDWHGREGPRRVLVYEARRQPRLLAFEDKGDPHATYRGMARRMARLFGEDPDKWGDSDTYDMARTLCEAGYDGWLADGFLGAAEGGGLDIVLCEPRKWLELKRISWVDPMPKGFREGRTLGVSNVSGGVDVALMEGKHEIGSLLLANATERTVDPVAAMSRAVFSRQIGRRLGIARVAREDGLLSRKHRAWLYLEAARAAAQRDRLLLLKPPEVQAGLPFDAPAGSSQPRLPGIPGWRTLDPIWNDPRFKHFTVRLPGAVVWGGDVPEDSR